MSFALHLLPNIVPVGSLKRIGQPFIEGPRFFMEATDHLNREVMVTIDVRLPPGLMEVALLTGEEDRR